MRCPSCNKFPALASGTEPEADLSVEEGRISGTVRIVLTSECCGNEIKEYCFDVEHEAEAEIKDALADAAVAAGVLPQDVTRDLFLDSIDLTLEGVELEVEPESFEVYDRYETKDRHGKPITKMRYQRHYWGYAGTVMVEASYPYGDKVVAAEIIVDLGDEISASSMDECC